MADAAATGIINQDKFNKLKLTEKERHNGIVAALKELKKLPDEFITATSTDEKVPVNFSDVNTLMRLFLYLRAFKGTKYSQAVELEGNLTRNRNFRIYLTACNAYIGKFGDKYRLQQLNTADKTPGPEGLNISVTAFYEKHKDAISISSDDIERYKLELFELIAKLIYMKLDYPYQVSSDSYGGKSRSSKKHTTRRRPRRKSTKRLRRRRASRTSRK